MKSTLRTFGIALAAMVMVSACSQNSPISPLESTSATPDALNKGHRTGTVYVVHGVPGLTVDIYINGGLAIEDFTPGTITDAIQLPEGNYDLAVVPANGNPANPAITGSTFLPAGASASIVAHLKEGGAPTLSVFVNDVSAINSKKSRIIARHTADAPAVDIRLFRNGSAAGTFAGVRNPQEGKVEVYPGRYIYTISAAGASSPLVTSESMKVKSRDAYIAYAVGSLSGGTFNVLFQRIRLPKQ